MLSRTFPSLYRGLNLRQSCPTVINKKSCQLFSVESKLQNDFQDSEVTASDSPRRGRHKVIKLPFNDTAFSSLMVQLKSKKFQSRSDLIYFEGKRIIKDAINAGVVPVKVYFSRPKDIEDLEFPDETELYRIPYNDMKLWSDLKTCPGILAICRKPVIEDRPGELPVDVICDQVRDPGNLGSIIRSSAAAGVNGIYLTPGCVDLWNPTVVRGGMGAHFKLPIRAHTSWESLQDTLPEDTLFLVATNATKDILEESKPQIIPYYELQYTGHEHISLVIGGETEGISDAALSTGASFPFLRVNIPLANHIESLNAVSALSVILFEIRRQVKAKSSSE